MIDFLDRSITRLFPWSVEGASRPSLSLARSDLSSGDVIITNDGVTILKTMQALQPAAKMLVELSKSQDSAAGVIAGGLLNHAASLLPHGIQPTVISEALHKLSIKAVDVLTAMAIPVELALRPRRPHWRRRRHRWRRLYDFRLRLLLILVIRYVDRDVAHKLWLSSVATVVGEGSDIRRFSGSSSFGDERCRLGSWRKIGAADRAGCVGDGHHGSGLSPDVGNMANLLTPELKKVTAATMDFRRQQGCIRRQRGRRRNLIVQRWVFLAGIDLSLFPSRRGSLEDLNRHRGSVDRIRSATGRPLAAVHRSSCGSGMF
ncbi:hypothetical protein ACLOJK_037932 [Asimina triloba]